MNAKIEECGVSFLSGCGKGAILALAFVAAGAVFGAHSKLGFCMGLLLVALISSFWIPPGKRAKRIPLVLVICLVAGIVRFLTP
jgi:hypothetical protein